MSALRLGYGGIHHDWCALIDVPREIERRVVGTGPLSTSTSLGGPQNTHEETRRREGWELWRSQ